MMMEKEIEAIDIKPIKWNKNIRKGIEKYEKNKNIIIRRTKGGTLWSSTKRTTTRS